MQQDKPPANWPFPTWRGQPLPKPPRQQRKPQCPPGEPAPF